MYTKDKIKSAKGSSPFVTKIILLKLKRVNSKMYILMRLKGFILMRYDPPTFIYIFCTSHFLPAHWTLKSVLKLTAQLSLRSQEMKSS